MSRLTHRARIAFILLGLMLASACGAASGDSPAPKAVVPAATASTGAVSVSIKNFEYSPQTLTVRVGTTVTWKNLDEEPHTVRGTDDQIRSNALDQNDTYSVKFDKPGTYKYGCSIHPQMAASIIVTP
ncbi:MAG: cupredoxin domain-containing protein [Terriglobales bacterium]